MIAEDWQMDAQQQYVTLNYTKIHIFHLRYMKGQEENKKHGTQLASISC